MYAFMRRVYAGAYACICILACRRCFASLFFCILDRFLDCLYLGLILQSIRLDGKGPCLRLLIMPKYDASPACLTCPYAIWGLSAAVAGRLHLAFGLIQAHFFFDKHYHEVHYCAQCC